MAALCIFKNSTAASCLLDNVANGRDLVNSAITAKVLVGYTCRTAARHKISKTSNPTKASDTLSPFFSAFFCAATAESFSSFRALYC